MEEFIQNDDLIIISQTSTTGRKMVQNWYKRHANSVLYAITFTMDPYEVLKINEKYSNVPAKYKRYAQRKYLLHYLYNTDYHGIFVAEVTKKGVTHLHGITDRLPQRMDDDYQLKYEIRKYSKGKFKRYFYDNERAKNSVLMQKLRSTNQKNATVEYLSKMLPPEKILNVVEQFFEFKEF